MAIGKQNRALLIFVVLVLAGLGYVLSKEGKFTKYFADQADTSAEPENQDKSLQESLGDNVDLSKSDDAAKIEKQKAFAIILSDLASCLNINSSQASDQNPVSIESVISAYQGELGVPTTQSDRWMNWHLHSREGQERQLHLEIKEDESGRPHRELHYYTIDHNGQPTSIELDPDRAENPSDDIINGMLKEGEVFYKDKAGFVDFPGGERIEYVEKNSQLAEIEFIKGNSFFRCDDLSTREKCQCTK